MNDIGAVARVLNIDQLAGRLGITIRHVRRLAAERRPSWVMFGRMVRFHPAEIAVRLDRSRVTAPPGQTRRRRPTMMRQPATRPDDRADHERGAVSEQRRYADHRPY